MKAVLQGFYASSNKVWRETVENPDFVHSLQLDEEEKGDPKEDSYLKATLKNFAEGRPKKYNKKQFFFF